MLRAAGIIFVALVLLAGCGSRQPETTTRGDYAVAVEATPTPPTVPVVLPAAPTPITALVSQASVAVPLLNVRAGPSAETELLGQVKEGETLPVLERSGAGDWLRVQLPGGTEGWVAAQYVRVETAAPQSETAVAATPVPPGVIPTDAVAARLVDVVDGRTLHVTVGGAPETVRLIGVDTPERDQPGFAAARRAVGDLLTPALHLVADRTDRDAGELLRYVYTDAGVLVNAELIRQGWALPEEVPPDTARAADFHLAAGEAAASGRGFWGGAGADGSPIYALAQGNIKIRKGPGTDFDVIGAVPDGTPLLVEGRTRDSAWLKVRAPEGSDGWVLASLLALAVDLDSAPEVRASN